MATPSFISFIGTQEGPSALLRLKSFTVRHRVPLEIFYCSSTSGFLSRTNFTQNALLEDIPVPHKASMTKIGDYALRFIYLKLLIETLASIDQDSRR